MMRSPLTRSASRELGRAEYWDPANKGLSIEKVWKKVNRGNPAGRSHIWRREFINGWYGATMLAEGK